MRRTVTLCLAILAAGCASTGGSSATVVLNSSCNAGPNAPAEDCKRVDGVQAPSELSAIADAWCRQAGYQRSDGFIIEDTGRMSYLNGVTCVGALE